MSFLRKKSFVVGLFCFLLGVLGLMVGLITTIEHTTLPGILIMIFASILLYVAECQRSIYYCIVCRNWTGLAYKICENHQK